jgi:FSR family fosmidomycin resistance protein-like MFS transporter
MGTSLFCERERENPFGVMEKAPLLLMFFGHVWVDASQGILPVVLTKLKELMELSYFQVGLVVGVLNITSSVIQPFFGYIADRLRTGWFVPWGILWTSICMGLLGWAPHYALVVILVGFAGFGTAAFHPRAMMVVSLVSGRRKGFGTAVFSTGGNLGFALGPIVGSLLVLGLGIHATVGLVLPAIVLTFTILFYPGDFLKRESPYRMVPGKEPETEAPPVLWGSLVLVCLIVTLRAWVYMSFITYLPMFLQGQGVELRTGSLILSLFLAGGAAAGLYGGHLSDRVGRKAVIIVSMLVYPVFASLMILSKGPWLWVLAGAAGVALLASFSVTIVLAQELLPRYLGLASGLTLGLGFGMGGLGTAVSGWIADWIGLYGAFWVLALVPALGSLMAALVKTGVSPQKAP